MNRRTFFRSLLVAGAGMVSPVAASSRPSTLTDLATQPFTIPADMEVRNVWSFGEHYRTTLYENGTLSFHPTALSDRPAADRKPAVPWIEEHDDGNVVVFLRRNEPH